MDSEITPIERACRKAGSQVALATFLKVTPPTVNQWVNGVRPIPVAYCSAIEIFTDGEVTRADLRPDDYWQIWPDLKAPQQRPRK